MDMPDEPVHPLCERFLTNLSFSPEFGHVEILPDPNL